MAPASLQDTAPASNATDSQTGTDATDVIAPLPSAPRSPPPLPSANDPARLIDPTLDPAAPGPLSPDQLAQFADADERKKKIEKAAGVAAFNAWSSAVLAVGSLLSVLFDPTAIVATVGLAIVAANEFKGRAQLRALEPSSLTRLMWNQILFAAMIIAYSIVQIVGATTGPGRYDEYMSDPALARMLGPIGQLHTNITLAVYTTAIVLSFVIQGSTAWYYHRKKTLLATYLKVTPAWILALQRR